MILMPTKAMLPNRNLNHPAQLRNKIFTMATKNNSTGKTGRRHVQLDDDFLKEMTVQNDTRTNGEKAPKVNLSWLWDAEKNAQSRAVTNKATTVTDVIEVTKVDEMTDSIPPAIQTASQKEAQEKEINVVDMGARKTDISATSDVTAEPDEKGKAIPENAGEETKTTAMADVNEVTEVMEADTADTAVSEPIERKATSPPRTTRISFKMREATRKGFCDDYTRKVDTKGGKPITIAPGLLERLQTLCVLSGDYRSCPTYIINNVIGEFLDLVEPEAKKWGTRN